jgi:signal transduction histidine kinase
MLKSIQGKYTAVIILVVTLFLSVLLAINYLQLRSHSFSAAEETAQMLLGHADKQIDLVFGEIEAVVQTLSELKSVKEVDIPGMRNLFIANVLSRQEYVRAIYLGTADGHMHEWGVGPGFIDHTPTFPDDYDPRERPWYVAGLDAGGYTLTAPYVYASIRAMGITAVQPVYTDAQELVGVLGLDLIIEGLQKLVASLHIEKGGKLILLNSEHEVLVNQFEHDAFRGLDLKRWEYPQMLSGAPPTTLVELYGDRYLVSRTTNEATGWQMLLFVPHDEILAFSNANLKIILFFDIILMLLLGTFVTYISRRLITTPLKEVITVMRHIERGNTTARIPLVQSSAEFKLIARLFNRLSDSSLASAKRMEAEVEKRTRDVLRLQKENMRLRIIEEKDRLYTNVHDSLGARLTGINISNNVAKHALERNEISLMREMHERIERNTQQGILDLKEILLTKDSDILTADDFIMFIEEITPERLSIRDIAFESRLPEDVVFERLGSSFLKSLRLVIQELVTNTLKHAEAYHVQLSITAKGSRMTLLFSDDGKGFDLKEAETRSFGLQGLKNRVEWMGGFLKITTKAGKGTRYEMQFKIRGQK